MERLIGNWIDDETSIEEIMSFVTDTYQSGDLTAFKGDAKFVRDDWAQKAFQTQKRHRGGLCLALASQCPEHLRPQSVEEENRLLREADYAFKQAVALCPYSPEAVYRYSNLLAHHAASGRCHSHYTEMFRI